MQQTLLERWSAVPWAPRYEVSTEGAVRFADTLKKLTIGIHRTNGYPEVSLRLADGRYKRVKVHCLAVEVFEGPRPDGMVVAHLNGNPGDPRLCNLAYVTQSVNMRHRRRHGTAGRVSDRLCGDAVVVGVRSDATDASLSYRAIADKYGIGENVAYHMIQGLCAYDELEPVEGRKRLHKYSSDDKARAIALVDSGVEVVDAASQLGVDHKTVRGWIDETTVPGRVRGKSTRAHMVPTERDAVKRLKAAGVSTALIASAFNIADSAVRAMTVGVDVDRGEHGWCTKCREAKGVDARREAWEKKRADGRHHGRAPTGYCMDHAGKLVPDEREQRLLADAAELRRGGAAYSLIASRLAKMGHTTRTGKAKFHLGQIKKYLEQARREGHDC